MQLYRAVDSRPDDRLPAVGQAQAAKRFFCKALAQPNTADSRTIAVDKKGSRGKEEVRSS
jgi:IS6 family transposase